MQSLKDQAKERAAHDKALSRAARKTQSKEEQPPPAVAPKPGLKKCYFASEGNKYYFLNSHGEYHALGDRLRDITLRAAGYDDKQRDYSGLTHLEKEILRIAENQSVHYAGPLGGYGVGVYDMGTLRCLVTRGPKLLEPRRGPWPVFKDYLQQLLGRESKYFLAWIKTARESLFAGEPWRAGQLLAIAGPPGAGKSFLQSLITHMLGGRASSPYRFMSGQEKFNAEIFGAEHGHIGDQNHKTDRRSRKAFGAAIKELVANDMQWVRGLHKGAATLSTFLRLSLTLNDNPHSLLVMPEMDGDVADKIILLHARAVDLPYPSKRFPDRHSYNDSLRAELPCFLWHLDRWKMPADLEDKRYGVTSYKSPKLVEAMSKLSAEEQLWNLIEMYILPPGGVDTWSGLSTELQREIADKAKGVDLTRLFDYPGACGFYLSQLMPRMPDNISNEEIGSNKTLWIIKRTITKEKS